MFCLVGRFRSSTSTSTSFQLCNRSTHVERESLSQLVLEAVVQYEFLSKSRTEQNEFGIDNIGKNKCAIHNSLNPLNIGADLLISLNPGVVLKAEISKHTNLQYEYELEC